MKHSFFFLCLIILAACNEPATENSSADSDTATLAGTTHSSDASFTEDSLLTDEDHAIFYITFADTGNDYYSLDKLMYELSSALNLQVDTMNRYYNKKKNEVVVRDDDEDEMYRGEYYPRRYGGDFLSIEHHYFFSEGAGDSSFALIAGIYENKQSADSMLRIIKPRAGKAYVSKASLFIGCMH